MRWYSKTALALGFVGAVAVGAAAFGQTGSNSPTPSSSGSVEQSHQQGARPGRLGRFGKRVVHGELKIKTQNGFATVVIDSGTVSSVDQGAKSLTLKRSDGETVSVTATDDTRVRKDGSKASFGDISVGDLVQVIRIDRGDGLVVRLIRVRSAQSGATPDATADAAGLTF